MKVSLVVPDFLSGTSFLQQPLDYLYTATAMQRQGFDVNVIDCRVNHLSLDNLKKHLRESEIIVITTTPSDQVQNYFLDYRYAHAINTINSIKNTFPKTPVVVCGAHVSVRPDLVVQDTCADYYIRGEIYATLTNLALAVREKTSIKCVPNIIIRTNSGVLHNCEDANYYHPVIDSDVFPDYSKVNMAKYYGVRYVNNIPLRRLRRAVVQGGRGCPYNCSFCHNFYGKRINRRKPEIVAEELFICEKKYGVEEIFFLDEVFTIDHQWLVNLVEKIVQRNIKLEYTIQTRADLINVEVLQLLKLMGVKNIWLGLESACNDLLNLSKKGFSIEQFNDVVSDIKKNGITPNAFFMLGMPGETIDTLNTTIKELYSSKMSYTRSLMICTPRYNTELYEMAVKQYPFVEEHWFNLNAVKGLVANEMTPSILQQAKSILKDREFMYRGSCPQL